MATTSTFEASDTSTMDALALGMSGDDDSFGTIPLSRVASDDSMADVFLQHSPRELQQLVPEHLVNPEVPDALDIIGDTYLPKSKKSKPLLQTLGWTNTILYGRPPKEATDGCRSCLLGDVLLRPLITLRDYDRIMHCVGKTTNTLACILYLWYPQKQLLVYIKGEGFARYAPEIHPALAAQIRNLRRFLPPTKSERCQQLVLCAEPTGHWNLWKGIQIGDSGVGEEEADSRDLENLCSLPKISNSTDPISLVELAHLSADVGASPIHSPFVSSSPEFFGSQRRLSPDNVRSSPSYKLPRLSSLPIVERPPVLDPLVHEAAQASVARHAQGTVRGHRRRTRFFTLTQAWTPNNATANT